MTMKLNDSLKVNQNLEKLVLVSRGIKVYCR